jgi:hypothetical protein
VDVCGKDMWICSGSVCHGMWKSHGVGSCVIFPLLTQTPSFLPPDSDLPNPPLESVSHHVNVYVFLPHEQLPWKTLRQSRRMRLGFPPRERRKGRRKMYGLMDNRVEPSPHVTNGRGRIEEGWSPCPHWHFCGFFIIDSFVVLLRAFCP